ncbi:hypothetical protein X729_29715 [Mesorhizobium sp. L103C131B0]|nr:hypothetical protein X729_29715 [Mesorhizobium sp. L103C131B0]
MATFENPAEEAKHLQGSMRDLLNLTALSLAHSLEGPFGQARFGTGVVRGARRLVIQ